MDELARWQMEDRARQAREIRDLVESGAFERARSALEQLQVASNPDFRAAAERAAAQVRELDLRIARAALEFQATYGELVTVFVRLHQVYAGIGSTFTVTSDESGPEGATTHERLLSLPAANVAVVDGELSLSGHVEAEVIKGSAAITLDDVTASATGRIIEESVSLGRTSTLSASATVINHHSIWSLERSENSQGQHVFVIRGIGGEEMRRKVDILVEVAQEVMNGEVAVQTSRHTLAADNSYNRETASSVANESKITLSIVDIDPWDAITDYRWDRRAVKGLWTGLSDPEIAGMLDHVDAKTVTNRLSVLRQQYPDHVPTRDELRKRRDRGKLG